MIISIDIDIIYLVNFKIKLVERFGFSNEILPVDIREVKYWIEYFLK